MFLKNYAYYSRSFKFRGGDKKSFNMSIYVNYCKVFKIFSKFNFYKTYYSRVEGLYMNFNIQPINFNIANVRFKSNLILASQKVQI